MPYLVTPLLLLKVLMYSRWTATWATMSPIAVPQKGPMTSGGDGRGWRSGLPAARALVVPSQNRTDRTASEARRRLDPSMAFLLNSGWPGRGPYSPCRAFGQWAREILCYY